MRDWPGINPSTEADPIRRDKDVKIDLFLRDLSRGLQRIGQGEAPDGSGATIGVSDHGALTGLADDDHLQYLLLAGRDGGQSAYGSSDTTSGEFLRLTGFNNPPISGGGGITTRAAQVSIGTNIFLRCDNLAVVERDTDYTTSDGFSIATGLGFANVSNYGQMTLYYNATAGPLLLALDTVGTSQNQAILNVYANDSVGTQTTICDWRLKLIGYTGFAQQDALAICHKSSIPLLFGGASGATGEILSLEVLGATADAGSARLSCMTMILSGQYPAQGTSPNARYAQKQGTLLTLDFATVNITGALTVSGAMVTHDHSSATTGGASLAPALVVITNPAASPSVVPLQVVGAAAQSNSLITAYSPAIGTDVFKVSPTGEVFAWTAFLINSGNSHVCYLQGGSSSFDTYHWLPPIEAGNIVVSGIGSDPATQPGEVALVARTVTADIASQDLTFSSAAGDYLIMSYMACTVSSAGGAETPSLKATWTDDAGTQTDIVINQLSNMTAGQSNSAVYYIRLASGNITWKTTDQSGGTYKLRIRVVYMGV